LIPNAWVEVLSRNHGTEPFDGAADECRINRRLRRRNFAEQRDCRNAYAEELPGDVVSIRGLEGTSSLAGAAGASD
jgi:hypothetical protein